MWRKFAGDEQKHVRYGVKTKQEKWKLFAMGLLHEKSMGFPVFSIQPWTVHFYHSSSWERLTPLRSSLGRSLPAFTAERPFLCKIKRPTQPKRPKAQFQRHLQRPKQIHFKVVQKVFPGPSKTVRKGKCGPVANINNKNAKNNTLERKWKKWNRFQAQMQSCFFDLANLRNLLAIQRAFAHRPCIASQGGQTKWI